MQRLRALRQRIRQEKGRIRLRASLRLSGGRTPTNRKRFRQGAADLGTNWNPPSPWGVRRRMARYLLVAHQTADRPEWAKAALKVSAEDPQAATSTLPAGGSRWLKVDVLSRLARQFPSMRIIHIVADVAAASRTSHGS